MKTCSIIFFVLLSLACGKELPSYIKKCKKSDPDLNKCLVDRAGFLKSKLTQGIPEMKLPPIEPLHIPKLEIHTGNPESAGFNAVLSDMEVYGGKDMQVNDMSFDLDHEHIFLNIHLPELKVKGNYNFNGKILFLQLNGDGLAELNLTDVDSTTHMNISIVEKNNKHYIDLGNDYKVMRNYGKIVLYFDNLFKGNKQLTEETNRVLNENIRDISKEIGPLLDESIHLLIVGLVKPFFDEFSIEELFDN